MRIRSLVLPLLVLGLVVPQAAAADDIIVKRAPGLDAAERADLRADAKVKLVETLALPRTELVSVPPGRAGAALRTLNADPDVIYAEPNQRRTAFFDPYYSPYQWALNNTGQDPFFGTPDADVDGPEVWPHATGAGQTVAVVDSGVDAGHEDLVGKVTTYDFVHTANGAAGGTDWNGHGTHVAGIVAAVRDNSVGIAGLAPGADVLSLRALDANGSGLDSDIAEAFHHAGVNDVRVVNASLGGEGASSILEDAITAAPDTLFVVAAGNGGADEVGDDAGDIWPCAAPQPNVLCVGASTASDAAAGFSNFGATTVDLFAPGDWILSTIPFGVVEDYEDEEYLYMDGTSMASPHVAATAALVLEAAPEFTPAQLKATLLQSGDRVGAFGRRSVTGRRVNAATAVAMALGAGPQADADGDGVPDTADMCPATLSSDLANGCPDRDSDGVADPADNCPTVSNPSQANSDGRADGGDACDRDRDNDGRPNVSDACPDVYAVTANGCPAVVVQPPPAPPRPPADADGDGRDDASDGCPRERASTRDGCPLPFVTSISTKTRKRVLTVRVRTSRAANVRITVQRRKCTGSRCRWTRVTRKTVATRANGAKLTVRRVRAGRHRAVVVLSSSAGKAAAVSKAFRVK